MEMGLFVVDPFCVFTIFPEDTENRTLSEMKAEDDKTYGDGDLWRRGELLGKGSFGRVFAAISTGKSHEYPSVMAVKSADIKSADSLQHEWNVLRCLSGCSSVIHCFGPELTRNINDGGMTYNLLLEYCSGGTLYDRIKRIQGESLPEAEVRWYTRSILEGLVQIHKAGFVHCDLKPENILLFPNDGDDEEFKIQAKICDFGLAKGAKEGRQKKSKFERTWQEAPADIWSVGIMVLEMLTGRPAWGQVEMHHEAGYLPVIPQDLSPQAKTFLQSCLKSKARNRGTAKSLLRHPFITGTDHEGSSLFSAKMALAFRRLRSSIKC